MCSNSVVLLSLVSLTQLACGEAPEIRGTEPLQLGASISTGLLVIDNTDLGFELLNAAEYHDFIRSKESWIRTKPNAFGADAIAAPTGYLRKSASTVQGASMAAIARWSADLEPGRYALSVFIPHSRRNSREAVYCVGWTQPEPDVECFRVDQRDEEGWYRIDTLELGGLVEVLLDPAASEEGDEVVADAISFEKVAGHPRHP
jgi:hypothetical protein